MRYSDKNKANMQGKRKPGSEKKRELDVEQDGGREHERKMKGGRDGQEGVGGG